MEKHWFASFPKPLSLVEIRISHVIVEFYATAILQKMKVSQKSAALNLPQKLGVGIFYINPRLYSNDVW